MVALKERNRRPRGVWARQSGSQDHNHQMSEFRKQRLLAKLFDSLSLSASPYDCLAELETGNFNGKPVNVPEAGERLIRELAQTSSDPQRFAALAQSMLGSQ